MLRAEPGAYRPVWMLAFYDEAELHSLALTGSPRRSAIASTAEYHAHRCLASSAASHGPLPSHRHQPSRSRPARAGRR